MVSFFLLLSTCIASLGSVLFVGSVPIAFGTDSTTRLWDVADGSFKVLNCPSGALDNLSSAISQVVRNPDGTLLATASDTAKANIWSITGDVKHSIDGHQGSIFTKWSKAGSYLLSESSSPDYSGYIWCPQTGSKLQTLGFSPAYSDCRTDGSFSAGLQLYTADGIRVKSFSGLQRGEGLCAAKWNTEGSLLAAGFNFEKVKVWSMAKEDCPVHSLEKHSNVILDIGWSPNSTLLASGSADQSLKLWNIEYGKEVTSLYHPRGPVKALAFDPHGLYILTVSSKILSVVSVKGGKVMKTFEAEGEVCQASWNNDGSKIAVCSESRSLHVIDMNSRFIVRF